MEILVGVGAAGNAGLVYVLCCMSRAMREWELAESSLGVGDIAGGLSSGSTGAAAELEEGVFISWHSGTFFDF